MSCPEPNGCTDASRDADYHHEQTPAHKLERGYFSSFSHWTVSNLNPSLARGMLLI